MSAFQPPIKGKNLILGQELEENGIMLEPDWKQEKPNKKAVKEFWSKHKVFSRGESKGNGITQVISAFASSHANGGVKFGTFSFTMEPILHWFVSRNRFNEVNFFEHLLASTAFEEAFPDIDKIGNPETQLEWEWSNAYVLAGDIANSMMFGGAYKRFSGVGKEAKAIAEEFTNELFHSRYEDIQVFLNYAPWSKWFHGIAWDKTWIVVDKRELKVWILFVTDID